MKERQEVLTKEPDSELEGGGAQLGHAKAAAGGGQETYRSDAEAQR